MEAIPFRVERLVTDTVRVNAKFDVRRAVKGEMIHAITVSLTTQIPAYVDRKEDYIQVHTNWIQAVKDRWLPAWLKKKFPIRTTSIPTLQVTTTILCPYFGEKMNGRYISYFATEGPKLMERVRRER